MAMVAAERTEGSAYDTMMKYVEEGLIPACVPVAIDGQQCVWTIGGGYNPDKITDELDEIAMVLLAITHAYKQGEEHGLVPVL